MAFNNFAISSFITMSLFLILKYRGLADKDRLISFLLSFFWMIPSLILSFVLLNAMKYTINPWVVIPTVLIESVYNFFLLKGDIDTKKLPKSLAVVALFFLSTLFQLIPIRLFHLNVEELSSNMEMAISLFSDFCGLLILIILYFKELKEDAKKLVKNFNPIMDTAIKYWTLGIIIMVVSNLLIQTLAPQSVAVNEESVQALIGEAPLLTFIGAAIFAPIIEELTFRKAFYDVFKKNTLLFVLTSGLVFGGLHVILSLSSPWDLLYIIPYGALGSAFAYILAKTDNVYASMIVHFLHNAILTSVSIFFGMVVLL